MCRTLRVNLRSVVHFLVEALSEQIKLDLKAYYQPCSPCHSSLFCQGPGDRSSDPMIPSFLKPTYFSKISSLRHGVLPRAFSYWSVFSWEQYPPRQAKSILSLLGKLSSSLCYPGHDLQPNWGTSLSTRGTSRFSCGGEGPLQRAHACYLVQLWFLPTAYSEKVSLSLQLVFPDRAKLDEILKTMQPESQATRLRCRCYTIDYREFRP